MLQKALTRAPGCIILQDMDKGVRTADRRDSPNGGPGAFSFFAPEENASFLLYSCVLPAASYGKIGPRFLGGGRERQEITMLREGIDGQRVPSGCAVSAIFSKTGQRQNGETSSAPSP